MDDKRKQTITNEEDAEKIIHQQLTAVYQSGDVDRFVEEDSVETTKTSDSKSKR